MSQLLAETLRGRFDFEIVDVIPSHEASLLAATAADLMVSTAPLRDCPIKGVVVSSSLGGADLERIRREVDRLRGSRRHVMATDAELGEARTLIHALEAVVTRGAPEAAGRLMPRIKAEVRQHFLHRAWLRTTGRTLPCNPTCTSCSPRATYSWTWPVKTGGTPSRSPPLPFLIWATSLSATLAR